MCLILIIIIFLFKEYKRLEREINENWPDPSQLQQQPTQQSGVILSAATALTEKSNNIH